MKNTALIALFTLISAAAFAAPKTVTLQVPTMNCATCPFTVKKALEQVDGVTKAEVTFKPKLARVTFNDEKTSIKALIEATTNAGYPSRLKE